MASVDLPEPLGPISAWISPCAMLRSTPRRISRSSMRTCRLRISRSAICGAPPSSRAGTSSERVVSCSVRTIEKRTRVHSSLVGQTVAGLGLARADDRAVGSCGDALDRGDRALERLDDLGHRDLVGGAGEQVAAARAAPALDQPRLAQAGDEVLEVGQRQPVRLGDLGERDGRVAVAPRRARPSRGRRTRPWWRTSSLANTYLRGRVSAGGAAPRERGGPRPRRRGQPRRICRVTPRSGPRRRSPSRSPATARA